MRGPSVTRTVCAWGLAGLAAILAGCADKNAAPGAPPPAPQPVQHPLLENVPLPEDFALVRDRSAAQKTGATRVAKCEFRGKSEPVDVMAFYKRHMPSAGFTLQEEGLRDKEYYARFESATETCLVRARSGTFSTHLSVEVGPKAGGGR